MKTKVPVTIVTFVHKDTKKTFSVVGDDDITSNSFEGNIFGYDINVTGLHKAISFMGSHGHKAFTTKTEIEIEIPA